MRRRVRALRSWVAAALSVALLVGCTSIEGEATLPDGHTSSAAGATPAADPTDVPLEPTSSDLIASAVASGDIDEATALLYRTWLLFGDPRYPQKYVGAAEAHDLALISELRDALDVLPTEIRDQIEPYLLRPTHERSPFSAGIGEAPGFTAAGRAFADRVEKKVEKKKDPPPPPCNTWETQAVPGAPFRVWACGEVPGVGTTSTAGALALASNVVAKYAGDMIADMGPVIPDVPDSDPRSDDLIDIYVLPAGWTVPHRGDGDNTTKYGVTVSTPPDSGVHISSYVLVADSALGDRQFFERILVHELFHVLQYTHNARLDSRWFYDASAEWAAAYYVRDDSARLHGVRLPIMQDTTRFSLASDWGLRPYGAYLWPLFMEQQAGAQSIFATWRALRGAPNGASESAVIDAINQQLDVSASFPEFAMRLLNIKGLSGQPNRPRFVDLDSHFPDGRLPEIWKQTLADKPITFNVFDVEGLGYRFYRVDVPAAPSPARGDGGVWVNISGDVTTRGGKIPVLDALVRGPNGDYRRQRIAYHGDGTDVCVAKDMLLVLSNHSTTKADGADGTFELRRVEEATDGCARIEVTNPQTYLTVADSGERIEVDGKEEDDRPDVMPLVLTVFDVDPEDVADYRVDVTLTGDTLIGARKLGWRLAEFDRHPPDRYVMSTQVRLVRDLTENNRPMSIDARLTLKRDVVHAHHPVVELHGEKPCTADLELAERENCEFVGDIRFTVDFDYQNTFRSEGDPPFETESAISVDIDSTLAVRVRAATQEGEYGDFYRNLGSRWTATGGYAKSDAMCQDDDGCSLIAGQEGTYQADVTVPESLDPTLDHERTLEPDDSPTALAHNQQGVAVRFFNPDEPRLEAIVPTSVAVVDHTDGLAETRNVPWSPFCPRHIDYSEGGMLDIATMIWGDNTPAGEPIIGTWNEDRTEIAFECSERSSGPWGHIAIVLKGTLKLTESRS